MSLRLIATGWLALAAPEPGAQAIGLAWQDQATVDAAVRQRLVDALVDVGAISPDEIIGDAVHSARRAVAYQVPRLVMERLAQLRAQLGEAAAAYRAGDLDGAAVGATRVTRLLEVDPLAPGSTRLAWRAHLLRAQVAWTQADDARTETALRAAVALDPEARLSTRRVPPGFAAEYRRVQAEVLTQRPSWPSLRLTVPSDAIIEVDGRPGLRPVPPGMHLLVVRQVGRAPIAAAVTTEASWEAPPAVEAIPEVVPDDRTAAQVLCDRLELGHLVLARVRDGRWGLQGYACGHGFGPAWYENPGRLREGVRVALGMSGERFDRAEAAISGDRPWPVSRVDPLPRPIEPVDRTPRPRPWYKRAWIWTLVGGVVAAGIITGAVLGARGHDRTIGVDYETFAPR